MKAPTQTKGEEREVNLPSTSQPHWEQAALAAVEFPASAEPEGGNVRSRYCELSPTGEVPREAGKSYTRARAAWVLAG